MKSDRRLAKACNAVIEKARAENAEGVAQEAAQLAESGIGKKTRPMQPLRFKRR
jgi:hypothetical protein